MPAAEGLARQGTERTPLGPRDRSRLRQRSVLTVNKFYTVHHIIASTTSIQPVKTAKEFN
jgi:hypothetical protein